MMNDFVLRAKDIKEFLEVGLDRPLEHFDMNADFYKDYGLDSMGAVALFVETERSTKVRVTEKDAPTLITGNKLLAFITEARQIAVSQEE